MSFLITIMSESGELKIEDNLIQMFDNNGTLRFNAGYSGTQYMFELYDENGSRSLYINDKGEAVFAGSIDTKQSVKVGDQLILRDKDGVEYAALYAGISKIWNGEKVLQMLAPKIDVFAEGDVLRLRGQNKVSIGTVNGGNVEINGEPVLSREQIEEMITDAINKHVHDKHQTII